MTEENPQPQSSQETTETKATPARCFLGAGISGSLAIALYNLTMAIINGFAHKPLPTTNTFTIKIAIAVRTLVMGMATLATGIFAVVTLGLILLGIQLSLQKLKQS